MIAKSKEMNELMEMPAVAGAEEAWALLKYIASRQTMQFSTVFYSFFYSFPPFKKLKNDHGKFLNQTNHLSC